MYVANDNKLVLAAIKEAGRPCTMAGVLAKTYLNHARIRTSLSSLHESGHISPGGRGAWVVVRRRPTKGDLLIGLFLMFAFGVGCGYAWGYMAVS